MQQFSEFSNRTYTYITERAAEASTLHGTLGRHGPSETGIGVLAIKSTPRPDEKMETLTTYLCSGLQPLVYIRLVLVALQELINDVGLRERLDIGLIVKPDKILKTLPDELIIRMDKDLGELSIADQDLVVDAILSWDIDTLVNEVFIKKLKLNLHE